MKQPFLPRNAAALLLAAALLPGLAGCSKQPQAALAPPMAALPPVSATLTATPAPEHAQAPSAAPPKVTIQLDYDYVRALLKDNRLQITIRPENATDTMMDYWNIIQYDVPYEVSGLAGNYTDLFVDTIGQDTWPYAFLLRDDGTVECVPIADPLYNSESPGPDREISFESTGVLPGVADVVSFREGSAENAVGGGYVTVFAESEDGTSCDLSFPVRFVTQPEDAPASAEDSLQMLTENAQAKQLAEQGMEPWDTGGIRYMYGEYARVFSFGADHEQQLARKTLFGVCASGAIYAYDASAETVTPANDLASLYSGADGYSELFAVITDPSDAVYRQFRNTAALIGTPVVGPQKPDPALIMPLKTSMSLKVERMADASDSDDAKVQDTLFDGTVTRSTPYLVGVPLSETTAPLRVTASWYDGFDDLVATWYTTCYQGGPAYTQYVSGEYWYPPNG